MQKDEERIKAIKMMQDKISAVCDFMQQEKGMKGPDVWDTLLGMMLGMFIQAPEGIRQNLLERSKAYLEKAGVHFAQVDETEMECLKKKHMEDALLS